MFAKDSLLIVIDVQGKLAQVVHDHEHVTHNIERLIRFAQALEIPIIWSEQAPDKIGTTIEPIASLLAPSLNPIPKRAFSCWGDPVLREKIKTAGRSTVVLCGIETHVCVYQTAADLKRHGYQVHVVEDAISSRTQRHTDIAVARMRDEGMVITSAEMAACQWLGGADHPKFKEVMANIKR